MYPTMLIIALIIDICAVAAFANVAKSKGQEEKVGTVWLLGLFLSFIVAGIYVAALPDRSTSTADAHQSVTNKDLPKL